MDFQKKMEIHYYDIVENYLKNHSEQALYIAQKFSRLLIEKNISPEEMIGFHKNIIQQLYPDLPNPIFHSFDVLLEVMIGYGLAFREFQNLRHIQQELRTEMEIAANVQKTLLGTSVPKVDFLDIGAISVPAKHVNGDYHHFVKDENDNIGIAIADVIGKGIPAALCMSMIKYAMDSLPENRHEPGEVLENLNRVVEQNIDPNMFITMFYGVYDPKKFVLSYSSAGHEPGFYYNAEKGEFTELSAKGLMLGVDKKTKYKQYQKKINIGDMIILMSDGVTECKTDNGFIEKEALIEYIKKYIYLDAQDIVQHLVNELERLQHFELRDDITLIILKRKV